MPATKNPNNDVKKLTEVVQNQKRTIGALQMRISDMSDQLSMVSSDLRKLREDVSEDLKTLFNKIES